MKNAFLTFLIFLSCLTLSAQNVVFILGHQFTTAEFDEINKKWGEFSEWKECKVTITWDLDKGTMKMDNRDQDRFLLTRTISERNGKTQDGDQWYERGFKALDKNGEDCKVNCTIFSKSGMRMIEVLYPDSFRFLYNGVVVDL